MASTPRQLIDQATRHAVYLERYKTQAVGEYQALLKRMERSAISALAGENITDWSRTRLNKELAAIRAAMREVGQGISGLMRRQSLALAEYEAGFEVRSLSKVAVNVDFTLPSDTQLRAAVFGRPLQAQGPYQGMLLESFFDEWPERAIARMDGAIRLGYARGRTTQQLVSDIYASGGAADMSRRSLSSVVRTGLAHSANEARQETWAANSDIIKAERIVATLDDRTSSECFVYSTKVISAGELENVFRANYFGQIFTVATATGKKLEGTPNHPILTLRGFLPINEIKPGEKVINAAFDDGLIIHGDKDVAVPSDIGEIFDSFNKEPVLNVSRKTPTAVDFYGDGVGMYGEVDIVSADSHLRGDIEPSFRKKVGDVLLSFIEDSRSLPALSDFHDLRFRERAAQMSSEVGSCLFERGIDGAFGSADNPADFDWLNPIIEQLNDFVPVSNDVIITLSALSMWHYAMFLEQSSNRGCGGSVSPAEFCRRFAGTIKADNVISVMSELRDCHVYTLQDSLGFYIAEGIIVKNCRSLDGQEFPLGKGPRPPFHINCRTTTVAVLDDRFAVLDEGGTRAARDPETGKVERVPAKETYYGWLKKQPESVQDSILGPTRGALLRDGGLSAQRFAELQVGRRFEPLTLGQMRRLEPVAFTRAGL